eukprot:410150_1
MDNDAGKHTQTKSKKDKPRKHKKKRKRKKKKDKKDTKDKKNDQKSKKNPKRNKKKDKKKETFNPLHKRSKKPEPRRHQTLTKHKAGSSIASASRAQTWINNIKSTEYYGGAYVDAPVIAAISREDAPIDCNYRCTRCKVWRKASNENDITKHLDSKVHKTTLTNNPYRSRRITSIIGLAGQIKYDWMFAAYKYNVTGTAMVGIANTFVKKHPPRNAAYIPKSEAQFSNKSDFMSKCFTKQLKSMIGKYHQDKYFHYSYMVDEGGCNSLGVLVGLTAFNAKDKPLLTQTIGLQTSSNSNATIKSFSKNITDYAFDTNKCRLFLCDSVAYNQTALIGIFVLCEFMHAILCPLHAGCNAQAAVMTDDGCGGSLLKRIYSEGSKLFKNSPARSKSWRDFQRDAEDIKDDTLMLQLMKSCDADYFAELYPTVDVEEYKEGKLDEDKTDEFDEDKTDENDLTVSKLVNLKSTPMTYIKNKWKVHIFLSFWWSKCFLRIIQYCAKEMRNEYYFLQLTDVHQATAALLFCHWYYLLRKWIFIILSFEKRKSIHHKAYKMIHGYLNFVKKSIIELKQLKSISTSPTPDMYNIARTKPDSLLKTIIIKMNNMTKVYHKELMKRYDDNSDTMKYWQGTQYLDPENDHHPERPEVAFKHIRFGLSMYANQPQKVTAFKRGYAHYRNVVVPAFANVSVENDHFAAIPFDKLKPNQWNLNLIIAKYKLDGDIGLMYERLDTKYNYGSFGTFAVEAVDNPNCDAENERVVSALGRVGRSKLRENMVMSTLIPRLASMWNGEIYEHADVEALGVKDEYED